MGTKTGISWADATWNCLRGCSRMVDEIDGRKESDPLCKNCYAARVASAPRLSGPGKAYEGLTVLQNSEPLWTGKVRFVESHLADPLRWKSRKVIFVNSMSDIAHENLDFSFIDQIAYMMAKADWHIYQVLTKRVGRLLEWSRSSAARYELMARLDHVHWGASIGTQRHADLRMPIVREWPAKMKWLSMEPLLEAVSLEKWLPHDYDFNLASGGCSGCGMPRSSHLHLPEASSWIKWIVVGGESGPRDKIRPTPLHYFRCVHAQAERAGIPFHMKQLSQLDRPSGFADPANFPEDLRVQQCAAETTAWAEAFA